MRRLLKEEVLDRIAAQARALPAEAAGCALCAVAQGPLATDPIMVRGNDRALAMLSRYALRPGHVVVLLRRHAERLDEAAWEDYAALHRLAWEAARALRQVLGPRRVFVAAREGADALPPGCAHLHLHVVPLQDQDDPDRPSRVLTYDDGVSAYDPGEAEALAQALRAATWAEPA